MTEDIKKPLVSKAAYERMPLPDTVNDLCQFCNKILFVCEHSYCGFCQCPYHCWLD